MSSNFNKNHLLNSLDKFKSLIDRNFVFLAFMAKNGSKG